MAPAAPARPKVGMGRFFMGMMIYLFASYLFQIVLAILDVKVFHNALSKTVLFKLPFGPVNIMTLLFIALLVGLLWGLYKFKVLPSSAELKAQNATLAASRSPKGGSALAKGSVPVKSAGAGKVNAMNKVATVGKPTSTSKLATTTAATNAKAKQAAANDAGENDDLYDQVRAQLRAQARKQRKR